LHPSIQIPNFNDKCEGYKSSEDNQVPLTYYGECLVGGAELVFVCSLVRSIIASKTRSNNDWNRGSTTK